MRNLSSTLKLWVEKSEFHGALIWLENGVRLRDSFRRLCTSHFERLGYSRVALPYILPSEVYCRQPEHFHGLKKYSFEVWAGNQAHGYLRTTSETPFTFLFKHLWSTRSFPLLFVQECTVFRNEPEHVQPPIRSVEIDPFIESYSAHTSEASARSCIAGEVSLYTRLLKSLFLPIVVSRRPPHDTFPEARFTIAFDAILPTGHVSQVATVHHLGRSFAQAFQWKVRGRYPVQTSTGISGRALGVCLLTHRRGDKAVLPAVLFEGVSGRDRHFQSDDAFLTRNREHLIATHLRYVTSLMSVRTPWPGVTAFPLSADSHRSWSRVARALPEGYRWLGCSYPPRRCSDPCIVTGRSPAVLCYIGRPL